MSVPYRIRRSTRARRARILVGADGVEVVVPARFPLRDVEPFVREKQPWIERTLARLRESAAELPPAVLADGGSVPYLGERLALAVRVEPGRERAHVVRRGDVLHVALPAPADGAPADAAASRGSAVDGAASAVAPLHDALEAWYRRRARAEVAPRLDAAVARAGTSYTRLPIRAQRTRWASCSSRGAMSFNYRLLLAPAEILDYVVEHEVAHLEVHDHSERFWALVARRVPEWREREAWLRRYGHLLVLPTPT